MSIYTPGAKKASIVFASAPEDAFDVDLYGESQQKQYSGKQLYDVNDKLSNEFSTTAQISEDGWVTDTIDNTSGTSTKYVNYWTNPSTNLKASTDYSVIVENYSSCTISVVDSATAYSGQFSSTFSSSANSGLSLRVRTTRDDIANCRTMLRTFASVPSGTKATIKFRISVFEDTTITADNYVYEPFVGNQPSPSPSYPQEIESVVVSEIKSVGKNIVTKESINTTYSAYITTENAWRYSADSKSVRVKAKPNTTYTVSINEIVSLFRVGCINSERYPSTDGEAFTLTNVVRNTSNTPITITTSADAIYIVVQVPSATKLDTLQIEEGTFATPFEEHKESKVTLSTPITLRGIGDVKDVLCKQDGAYGVETKLGYRLFQGNSVEEWQTNSTVIDGVTVIRFKIDIRNANKSETRTPCLSNRFIYSSNVSSSVGSCFIHSSSFWIYVDQSIKTVTELKTWLMSNNVEVIYPINTPYFTKLNEADNEQLNNIKIYTYNSTDSAIKPTIEVEKRTVFKKKEVLSAWTNKDGLLTKIYQAEFEKIAFKGTVIQQESGFYYQQPFDVPIDTKIIESPISGGIISGVSFGKTAQLLTLTDYAVKKYKFIEISIVSNSQLTTANYRNNSTGELVTRSVKPNIHLVGTTVDGKTKIDGKTINIIAEPPTIEGHTYVNATQLTYSTVAVAMVKLHRK